MDASITHWVNSFSGVSPLADAVMVAITTAGVPLMVVAVALQWWSRTDRQHVRHAAVSAGLSFFLGLAINQVVLLFISRVRPYDAGVTQLIIDRSGDWSFPSDHATATASIAATFLLQGLWGRGAALAAFAVLVGLSRVYVGTHYVTDVLGGALIGVAAALAVRALYREGTKVDRAVTGLL